MGRDALLALLLAPPFTDPAMRKRRARRLVAVVNWIANQPGDTWQARWQASGADAAWPLRAFATQGQLSPDQMLDL